MSPFATTTFTEWLRAASWRAFAPQPHVRLDYGSFVTFYHPRLHSLASARAGQPMRKHRAWLNLSDEDAQSRGIQRLPETLQEAIRAFDADELARTVLGPTMHSLFSRYKRDEWQRYSDQVTPWEQAEYLQFF